MLRGLRFAKLTGAPEVPTVRSAKSPSDWVDLIVAFSRPPRRYYLRSKWQRTPRGRRFPTATAPIFFCAMSDPKIPLTSQQLEIVLALRDRLPPALRPQYLTLVADELRSHELGFNDRCVSMVATRAWTVVMNGHRHRE
jgi:hypothetical protein